MKRPFPSTLLAAALAFNILAQTPTFDPFEATVPQIRTALTAGTITCRQLVQYYFDRMDAFDTGGPMLNSIRARNPRALEQADAWDRLSATGKATPLGCIPVVLKDNVDTLDMPTTAGSVALENTFAQDDAFLVKRLKAAGAIIIAKANLTEYANYLTAGMPTGYSSLGGYVLNPYDPRPIPAGVPNSDGRQALGPGGSSAGPGVVAAANLAAITVGTETSGSILSPANANSIVGIKPTVGLISRGGVLPLAAAQDTAGPMTRTVTDAAIMLGAMTGIDGLDPATVSSAGNALLDYTPFLKADALAGARLGIARQYWNNATPEQNALGNRAFALMRSLGAEVFDVEIASFTELGAFASSVLRYEFKRDLNAYLATRDARTGVKSLADVIAFNAARPAVALKYGQTLAIASQAVDLYGDQPQYIADRATDLRLAKVQGIDATMTRNNLTALLMPANTGAAISAKAGYPSVIVPGGYLSTNAPFGITFAGKAYSEATLIGLAYAFEQATKYRVPPGSALRVLPVSTAIAPTAVANYADGVAGAVAPGQIVAITGSGLGPAQAAAGAVKSNNVLDTAAGGTRVLFDGIPAPILSAQASQIVAIVPYGVAGKARTQLRVEMGAQRSAPLTVTVTDAAPAIFTDQTLGRGEPIVLNADGSRNSATNPARRGTGVTFFATGAGVTSTLPIDGRLPAAPFQTPLLRVAVTLGGAPLTLPYAGAAPGYPGQLQVNAQLDATAPTGTVPLVLTVGDKVAKSVPVYVQ